MVFLLRIRISVVLLLVTMTVCVLVMAFYSNLPTAAFVRLALLRIGGPQACRDPVLHIRSGLACPVFEQAVELF